ncbi:unnamed protein product [Hydatigera taeniaeformis]|uniref:Uncharacterized protein n=1 Tax=Hydatigena taeniaeformis TaxID=6205 RepID=A0A3P7G678_HYDTA|nr:unnamed protein product [Hydatigera taeniaeformis]
MRVNEVEVREKPILFTNGRIYYTNAPLKYIQAPHPTVISTAAIVVSLLLVLLILLIVGLFILRHRRPDLAIFNLRRSRFHPMVERSQASWRGSKGVLLASDDPEE